jgi:hypothetical protein
LDTHLPTLWNKWRNHLYRTIQWTWAVAMQLLETRLRGFRG